MAVNITVSKIIQADKNKIYKEIRNVESFPEFMRDVKEVEIIEEHPQKLITKWKTDIDGVPIEWVEEDIFDDRQMNCRFRALQGDYKYEGIWELKSPARASTGTEVSITANFDWEVPSFEQYVGDVLEKKARWALKGMLNAIKRRCDG